jgi:hypothetical protein
VVFAGDQVELHVKALGPEHPAEQLLGFRAPSRWDAFGVTVTGRSVPFSPDGSPGPIPARQSLALTFLVDRTGASASMIVPGDGEPILIEEPDVHGAQGIVADVCRRVLGIPTPPPECPVGHLWSVAWLDRIVACALDDPCRPPSWEVVAALHPAVACLADLDPTLVDAPERTLTTLGSAAARAWTWTAARESPAAAGLGQAPLPPEILDWMDDGIFSRWVLGGLPELTDLRATAAEVLPSRVADRVDDVLRAWNAA